MTGVELLALVRELLRDETAPYLWADNTIYKYLNDAQRIMAERSHCIINDEDYTVDLEAGVRSYTLEDEVLLVLAAQVDGETDPLRVGFTPLGAAFFANTESKPTNYTMTGGAHKISFAPTPDTTYTVNLVVAVRPTTTISATVSPEVPAAFHTALADYAASKCLIHNDVDGLNPAAAEAFGGSFLEAVRDLKRQIYQHRLGPDANVVPMRIT